MFPTIAVLHIDQSVGTFRAIPDIAHVCAHVREPRALVEAVRRILHAVTHSACVIQRTVRS